jgi:hypothetical protein
MTPNHPNYPQIDGIPLRAGNTRSAWKAQNWADLYGEGELRGEDDTIPGVPGDKHRDKPRGALRALIDIRVFGDVDEDGDPHEDVWEGLHANLDVLRGLCGGLRTIEVYHDETLVLEGEGEIVGGFRPQFEAGRYATVVFDVKVHAGRLFPPDE